MASAYRVFVLDYVSGAGGGSRTRVSALGRLHNSRYTTPAGATLGGRTPDLRFTKAAL